MENFGHQSDAEERIGSRLSQRLRLPLPYHESDVLIEGEIGEAFHTPAWQRPLDLDPVNLGALADAQHYARIVRGQITSRSRLEMGPLQVSGLPGNQRAHGIGIRSLRDQLDAQPMV